MRLSEIPDFLEHELKYSRFDGMRAALQPFLESERNSVLKNVLTTMFELSEELNNAPDTAPLKEMINKLQSAILDSNMGDFEPDLLHKSIEVYNFNNQKVAFLFKEAAIEQSLIKVMRLFYPLQKSYFQEYYLKDIFEGNMLAITDNKSLLLRLSDSNASGDRLIPFDLGKIESSLMDIIQKLQTLK